MNLHDLAEALEAAPNHPVVMHSPPVGKSQGVFRAGELGSYRGYYEQLAIDYWSPTGKHERPPTAHELATNLRRMQYQVVTGYKGGHFEILPTTDVWVSSYGECTGWKVVNVATHLDQVIIETVQEDW